MTTPDQPSTPAVDRPHPRLRVETSGAVMTVTLDAPEKRNAQVPAMWAALAHIATTLPDHVRVVVLAGEGPAFSAGLDRGMLSPAGVDAGVDGETGLLELTNDGPQALADRIAEYQRAFTAWQECPAYVIAAVQGPAIGAGFQLALAADLRIVTTNVRLAMAEVTLGLVPDLGGTAALTRLVGASRALELCLTGRPVGAEEAVATGIASLAVEPEELRATVGDLVEAVLAAPEQTAREMLGLFRGIESRTPDEQLRREREAQARLLCAHAEAARRR